MREPSIASAHTGDARPQASNPQPGAPLFQVHGLNPRGERQTVMIQAPHQAEAKRMASAGGLRVMSVMQPAHAPAQAADAGQARSGGRPRAFPLLLFTQELVALLDAGLNLLEAIQTLLAKERRHEVQASLQQVVHGLKQGRNFSDILADSPQRFPEVYVASVRASERTGDLARALKRYIAYQIQFEDIRKKLISAAIYPTALLTVGAGVFFFLVGYVVPRFSSVYDASGKDIPFLSLQMLNLGRWIHAHWLAFGVSAMGVMVGSVWALWQPHLRSRMIEAVLRWPGLAAQAEEFRLARFYRALSLLLASGVALPKAMAMVDGLLSPAQQARLAQARQSVLHGQSLSAALTAGALSTPVAESLMKVGERSGQMAEMLERIASFHDEAFTRWIDWASRLLEPVLMAVIGIVIGVVVLLMYMPIFDLAGSLQ